MKCPNCGEEMTDGALYCEHCGEDIHIVPDFEPELESNLEQTISGIVEELDEPSPEIENQEKNSENTKKKRHGWQLIVVFLILLFAV